jgi:nucleotide-binding universal stress UspA family protein
MRVNQVLQRGRHKPSEIPVPRCRRTPVRDIVKLASDLEADLVVVGTSGTRTCTIV